MPAPVDVAVRFIEAFGRRDMTAVADCIADDLIFESPRTRTRGAEAFLAEAGPFAQAVEGVEIIAALGDGERAMIMYDMTTGPFGTLRAVDLLVVRDGRIVSDTLVFDTHPLRGGT